MQKEQEKYDMIIDFQSDEIRDQVLECCTDLSVLLSKYGTNIQGIKHTTDKAVDTMALAKKNPKNCVLIPNLKKELLVSTSNPFYHIMKGLSMMETLEVPN